MRKTCPTSASQGPIRNLSLSIFSGQGKENLRKTDDESGIRRRNHALQPLAAADAVDFFPLGVGPRKESSSASYFEEHLA